MRKWSKRNAALKTPKKLVIIASNRSTLAASFILKIKQIVLFKGFPRLNFFQQKSVLENGLSNSCTKNQVTPMVSFVNIEELKMKILSEVK